MSYRQLYDYCQGLQGRIGRRQLFPKVCELTGLPRPQLKISSDLDADDLLGHIRFPGGGNSPLDGVCGDRPLIVVARSLDEKWQRHVMTKELMHYFDFGREKVSTGREFEDLLFGLLARLPKRSAAVFSEDKAQWMALGVVCPEERRQELQRQVHAGDLTTDEVSDLLGLPEPIVPFLFDPNFKDIIDFLVDGETG